MRRNPCLIAATLAILTAFGARAEQLPVVHTQQPLHSFMVTRSSTGTIIARDEFLQTVQGGEVTMHLTYRFLDGSLDDEVTTYTQQGKFHLLRDHHVQTGPFFTKPVDFTADVANSASISRAANSGSSHAETKRIDFPSDVANGIVGTLLLNMPSSTAPTSLGLLVPLQGGRLIRIVVTPQEEEAFHLNGQVREARVYRIHPELGGIVGFLANLMSIQPKDVMVWVMQGDTPAVVRIIGQLGGYGPIVDSTVDGTSFEP